MLKRSDFEPYQEEYLKFALEKRKCGLFLGMGSGKTTIALTAAQELIDDFAIMRCLVIAPLRVANTVWKQEAEKWEHLQHLKIDICTGDADNRRQMLNSDADIHVINRENIPWIIREGKWRWDMVIVDESTSFKNHASKRFAALRKVLKHTKSMILLTGTPIPKGAIDLWSQLFLIDQGERLDKFITHYRNKYFVKDYMGHKYIPRDGAYDQIKEKISDVCVSRPAVNTVKCQDLYQYVEMPKKLEEQYKELEEEFIVFLNDDKDKIKAKSAASLSGKLLQMCNGAVYDESGVNYHVVHDLKIEAMKDFLEDNPGENFLIGYNYKHDLKRLKKAFPELVVLSKSGKEVPKWNKGEIRLMAVHPASGGHGLNIQDGGAILIWFGLNWSLELYQQLNGRLFRKGQKRNVKILHLVMKKGLDQTVMGALKSGAKTQDELIEYLKLKLK